MRGSKSQRKTRTLVQKSAERDNIEKIALEKRTPGRNKVLWGGVELAELFAEVAVCAPGDLLHDSAVAHLAEIGLAKLSLELEV